MSVVFSEKFMRELEKSLGSDRALRITSALGPIIESDPIMRTAPEVAAQTVIGMAKMLGPDASADEIIALYRQGMEARSPGKSAKKKWWRFGR
jgi:hypothetical protein